MDVTNEAILVGSVRYVHEHKIKEHIFCFSSLSDRNTGERIFEAIKTAFEQNELDFKNVIGLCTDGASAITGKNVGLAKRMSEVANENFESSHCILHRESLASNGIPPILNATLMTSVQIINNIRANALHSRLLSLICADMRSDYDTLLLHAEVRWLSRGKTLARLFELRQELIVYFEKCVEEFKQKSQKSKRSKSEDEKKIVIPPEKIFLNKLKDNNWLSTLAYMVDVFGRLNELNVQTQGRNMDCFVLWNKLEAFKKKTSYLEK